MDKRRLTIIKLLFFFLLIASMGGTVWYYSHGAHFTKGQFVDWVAGFKGYAPFLFILAYGALVSFGFPTSPLIIAGALIFGRGMGIVINTVGLSVGAAGAFWVARFFMGEFFAHHLKDKKWMEEFNEGVKKNGFYYILFIRLVPIPFGAVNYAAALTKIPFRPFVAGTALGVLPPVIVLTNAAVEVGESATHGFHLTGGLIVAVVLVFFLALVPALVRKALKKRASERV